MVLQYLLVLIIAKLVVVVEKTKNWIGLKNAIL